MREPIFAKVVESRKLTQQATNNTKEQFANPPNLKAELLNAIMGALDAHTSMSTQALISPAIKLDPATGAGDDVREHAGH